MRAIGLIMRDLFQTAKEGVLLMAALHKEQEIADDAVNEAQTLLENRYALTAGALAPYFAHQAIDAKLGHQRLFEDNPECFTVSDPAVLDAVIDKLHDLKHTFDLQALEIRHYYGAGFGAYVPRQPMTLGSI